MKIKKHIPNIITLFNLLAGCFAIHFAFTGYVHYASYFIGAAALFDFFDGFAARLLKTGSVIGKELDSLADVVSFGVAPGAIMFSLIQAGSINSATNENYGFLSYTGFLIPLFSALRLAKFNVDERQHEIFIGLPTPANALFIASLPLIILQHSTLTGINIVPLHTLLSNILFLVPLTLLLSWLLVAGIPLMSLKFKTFHWKSNKNRYFLLIISALLIIMFYFAAVPAIILLYILLSMAGLKPLKKEPVS
jgi:CDP-diacylglycerol--serine O-phosphatidyltransferase